jgi:hypothetical protein
MTRVGVKAVSRIDQVRPGNSGPILLPINTEVDDDNQCTQVYRSGSVRNGRFGGGGRNGIGGSGGDCAERAAARSHGSRAARARRLRMGSRSLAMGPRPVHVGAGTLGSRASRSPLGAGTLGRTRRRMAMDAGALGLIPRATNTRLTHVTRIYTMKTKLLIAALLATVLAGCVVVPAHPYAYHPAARVYVY